jgi:hypothetical protein
MNNAERSCLWCILGIVVGVALMSWLIPATCPQIATGTDTVGLVTVDLPSGHYTYKAEGAYKYGSDGKLLWCRVKPWTANSK